MRTPGRPAAPGGRPRGRSGHGSAIDTHKIREWARGQGIEIKDRGRIPADIVEKYRQATGQKQDPGLDMAATSDISWTGPGGTFNLRAAAVICRRGEILLCTVDGLGYWFLPVGRVRFGEPGAAALARELAEELGHQLRVGDLAFVAENIFAGDGIQYEIGRTTTSNGPACWTRTICDEGSNWAIGSAGRESRR